jgi:hypothetical protein
MGVEEQQMMYDPDFMEVYLVAYTWMYYTLPYVVALWHPFWLG